MTTELGIHVYGEPGEIDAGKVLAGLRHILDLLKSLEDVRARGRSGRSTWRFTALGLNSVDTSIAVLEPRHGFTEDDVDAVVRSAVDGLVQVEGHSEIPQRWSAPAIDSARKATEALAGVTGRGVRGDDP